MKLPELRNRLGMANAVAMVVMIVLVAVVLIVGVWIFSAVTNAVNQSGWTTSANTTYTSILSTAWSGFSLAVVSIIVIAAVAIIGILLSGFRFGGV